MLFSGRAFIFADGDQDSTAKQQLTALTRKESLMDDEIFSHGKPHRVGEGATRGLR
jgi:hypothetical protein